jgi:FAD binding domain/Berberine and berberine like
MRSTTTFSVDKLRKELTGQVIGPEDPAYDSARTVFSGEFDRRPAAVVRVADANDVARVIGVARDTGLELAVRSGGHSGAGHSATEGGIVIDLRAMKALDVDVEERTAWAQTGLTAAEYSTATGAHGLATGFGDTGSVGIGGITLGGGVGYLVRKYGMTIDDLLAAEIVTADGDVLHVDDHDHPDLFWAIRGGGGNFGVATRFRFRLHEVDRVVGGMMMLPAAAEVIASFIAEAAAAPDELSTIANVMVAPPLPMIPEEYHGRLVLMGLMCYAGDVDAGQEVLSKFRALAQPMAYMIRPIAYPEIYPPEVEGYRPTAASRTMFIERVDEGVARTILDHLGRSDAPVRATQLRVLGGAMARVPSDATAFAHRRSKIMANVAAFWETAELRTARERWVDELAAALKQSDDGLYVNFMVDQGPAAVRRAYPGAAWERLVAVKDRYDPSNVFRLNQNIPPTSRHDTFH